MSSKRLQPSISGVAERIGVSHTAIREAALDGRLTDGVHVDDKRRVTITDAQAVMAQWKFLHEQDPPDVPSLALSRARREAALADLAELDVAERRGELIDVDQARRDVINKFTIVRTRILGVPARVAQRMPEMAAVVVPLLDELIREALEELAVDGNTE